jgi:hypothetical protein
MDSFLTQEDASDDEEGPLGDPEASEADAAGQGAVHLREYATAEPIGAPTALPFEEDGSLVLEEPDETVMAGALAELEEAKAKAWGTAVTVVKALPPPLADLQNGRDYFLEDEADIDIELTADTETAEAKAPETENPAPPADGPPEAGPPAPQADPQSAPSPAAESAPGQNGSAEAHIAAAEAADEPSPAEASGPGPAKA